MCKIITYLILATFLTMFSCKNLSDDQKAEQLLAKIDSTIIVDHVKSKSELTKLKDIALKNRKVLNNKLSILLPSDFDLMPEEMLNIKYPIESHRPTEVYTNMNGTVNVAFNFTKNNATKGDLLGYKSLFEQQFSSNPQIDFRKSKLKQINGQDFIIIEFVTPAVDTHIYNKLFITSLNSRLLICTFNCTLELFEIWESTSNEIVNSVKIL